MSGSYNKTLLKLVRIKAFSCERAAKRKGNLMQGVIVQFYQAIQINHLLSELLDAISQTYPNLETLMLSFIKLAPIKGTPTEAGVQNIKENHRLFKFLEDTPIRELADDDFLLLKNAENSKLLSLTINFQTDIAVSSPNPPLNAQLAKQSDEVSKLVMTLNKERIKVTEVALEMI